MILSMFNMHEDLEKSSKNKILKLLKDALQDQGHEFETLIETSLLIEENYVIPDTQDHT